MVAHNDKDRNLTKVR